MKERGIEKKLKEQPVEEQEVQVTETVDQEVQPISDEEVKAIAADEMQEVNPMLKFPWSDEEKVDFKYADMHVWCRNCGDDNGPEHPMYANMQTGLYTQTKTDSQSYIALACRNCGSQLVLHFRDAVNPPTPEEEAEMERVRLEEREKRLAVNHVEPETKEEEK